MDLAADDPRRVLRAEGVLAAASRAGILEAADVHVCHTLSGVVAETDPHAQLALALAVRAVRRGSVCLDLRDALDAATLAGATQEDDTGPQRGPDAGQSSDSCAIDALTPLWPTDADAWLRTVRDSNFARSGVLRVEFDLVYLDRYHQQEQCVARILRERAAAAAPSVDAELLESGLTRLFPDATFDEQRDAADRAVRQWTTVLTGGPGTGKTSTVARLLVLLSQQWERDGHTRAMRVALAAPTGKAAARLQESVTRAATLLDPADADRVRGVEAMTLHRLLGWHARGADGFRFNARNRLPHDVVVVDETSMVALTMMSRLLEALRRTSRLLLVGDADQLASVDAGAVMADLVDGYQRLAPQTVCRLRTSHRFDTEIAALAAAVRDGRESDVVALLRDGGSSVRWIDHDDPVPVLRDELTDHAVRVRQAAAAGDVPGALSVLGEHRLLCARRSGARGVSTWNHHVDQWLSEATGDPLWEPMYVGRPILVTRNDYALGVHNGDTGVVMRGDGPPVAQIGTAAGPLAVAAGRLSDVETMHAMTIHKAQGSEAEQVTVLLPDRESALLTRELLYTAITRARRRVTVVGSEETVRAAVAAQVRRATGLRQRLAK